jgi:anti-sigma B factor antagonist
MLLDLQLNDAKDTLEVYVDGDVDVNSVKELKKGLEENIEAYHPNVIVDCGKMNYIDSTGLGVLVSVLKKVQKYDGRIQIVALKPYLYKIFEVTGLTRLFEIEVAG